MQLYKEALIANRKDIKVHMNAAAGVIVKEDENGTKQILLLQRARDDHWPNHWEFPRGKCDKGKNEDTMICAKREIKEECGLDIRIIGLVDTIEYLADAGKRLTTCYNYLCVMENPEQEVKLSSEHQDYKWISEIGEVELLVLSDQKKTIEKALNSDRSIVSYPENEFTQNNTIEEYLKCLYQK
jgi:8-oxo-dGTP diphosphatase